MRRDVGLQRFRRSKIHTIAFLATEHQLASSIFPSALSSGLSIIVGSLTSQCCTLQLQFQEPVALCRAGLSIGRIYSTALHRKLQLPHATPVQLVSLQIALLLRSESKSTTSLLAASTVAVPLVELAYRLEAAHVLRDTRTDLR